MEPLEVRPLAVILQISCQIQDLALKAGIDPMDASRRCFCEARVLKPLLPAWAAADIDDEETISLLEALVWASQALVASEV